MLETRAILFGSIVNQNHLTIEPSRETMNTSNREAKERIMNFAELEAGQEFFANGAWWEKVCAAEARNVLTGGRLVLRPTAQVAATAAEETGANPTPEAIDITPTWGEWANVYRRLAESGETRAVRELRTDFCRAMAAAAALNAIRATLTDEQAETVSKIVAAELEKQS